MSRTSASQSRSPWAFFVLVFMLAAPFWFLGAETEQGLLSNLGVNLPFSALAFVCPITAALILTYRDEGSAGVAALLRRLLDPKRTRRKAWYVPIILLLPLIYSLSYGAMRLLGVALPPPNVSFVTLLLLFGAFFVSAAGEEAGWSGYALDPLQDRWGALRASLIVGGVWAAVHVVPDLQGHHEWVWIAGQRCFTVAFRVLLVWIYDNTGRSVFAATLVHDMDNVSVFTLFPNTGDSHYIPAITAAITVLAAAIVTFLWGPTTLAHYRFAGAQSAPPGGQTRSDQR